MAEIIRLRPTPHNEVQELLPWLVNGTLGSRELELVEEHLAECEECRDELAVERKLAHEIASIPIDWDSGLRSRPRVEMHAPVRENSPVSLWHSRVPFGWAVGSPLAAAAAVALVFVNIGQRQPVEPQYRALSAPVVVQPANLVIQFEPATRVDAVQSALEAVDARLVDGPTETGAYLLRVDQGKREQALKRLRDNEAIALAEPIDGPARQ